MNADLRSGPNGLGRQTTQGTQTIQDREGEGRRLDPFRYDLLVIFQKHEKIFSFGYNSSGFKEDQMNERENHFQAILTAVLEMQRDNTGSSDADALYDIGVAVHALEGLIPDE